MITGENLQKLATRYQTGLFPNIVREYFQHVFLSELYKRPEAENLLFKGGTALRIVYGSPRFSEDKDCRFLYAAGVIKNITLDTTDCKRENEQIDTKNKLNYEDLYF